MFIGSHHDRRLLALRNLDRHDLVIELAGGLRLGPALLALQSEAVLVRAGNPVQSCDILGGLTQRDRGVPRRHRRIHEAPADRGVVQFLRAAIRLAGLAQHVGRAAHRLHSSRHHDVAAARLDHARGHIHGLQTRRAEPVDRGPRDLHWKPRKQRRHARDISIVLARLVRGAEVDLVDKARIHAGPRHHSLDHVRSQVIRPHRGQGPTVTPDGSANGCDDGDAA